ncbi:MAG TPA: ABC transporter substrate-binding protein [Thermoanaerobaculia bacterium]|jgi:peptide/nickel transport system substrate-binding protein|nr:ABC transporter substrate-binding protein [Thermoanaerobaculia bacterium]
MTRCAAVSLRTALVGAAIVATFACGGRPERAHPAPSTPAAPTRTPVPELGYLNETGEPVGTEGGTLVRRLTGEPATLDPILQSTGAEAEVLQYLARNLFDFDAALHLVPGLAEGIQVSPDGLEYTVRIRPDAVWEDGSPVTARDAVFTIKRIMDSKVAAPVFKPLFEDCTDVSAVDDKTFRARFKEPYAFRAMAFVVPVIPESRYAAAAPRGGRGASRAAGEKTQARRPLSDGAYRIASWTAQQSIVLERNPRAWGAAGHFDRIVFRVVPDNTTGYRLLTSRELDEDELDSSLKRRAGADADFVSCCRTVEFYNLDYNYIALNNRTPMFSDARVRRAVTMLLDRAAIVRGLYAGSARIISGPWAPDSPAYDPNVAPLPFSPSEAARLLDEAGWRDSDGDGRRDRAGKPFEFELLVSAGSEVGRQIDETLAAELAKVGIAAHVRELEWAAFVERVDGGSFDAASLAWSAVDPNPDPYFYWDSSQCAPIGLNSGCYRNPEADSLMREARREMDPAKRMEILHRLHRLFRDDAPAVFVVNATRKYAFARRVRGLTTSPLGLFGIWPGPLAWWAAGGAGNPAAAPALSPAQTPRAGSRAP